MTYDRDLAGRAPRTVSIHDGVIADERVPLTRAQPEVVAGPSAAARRATFYDRDDRVRGRRALDLRTAGAHGSGHGPPHLGGPAPRRPLSTSDTVLDTTQLAELRAVPGVVALDARTVYETRIIEGDRRRDMLLVGSLTGTTRPSAIGVDEGAVPQGAEVVTDRMNARSGRYSGDISDELQVADSTGIPSALEVSGRSDTLLFSEVVAGEEAVLYAPQSTVNELAGSSGVNSIEFRVEDPEDADAVATGNGSA